MDRKLGFWSIFALVTGSQIGSGVFMLPASIAPFGLLGLAGWIISGIGAVGLALVFGKLCSWLPKTGGPHVYANAAFGSYAAFFVGWTYWVISWVSTPIVVVATIGYLMPLLGVYTPTQTLFLEIGLVFLITLLNLRGVSAAGHAEVFLTFLKIIPLVIMPCAAFFLFKKGNFLTPQVASYGELSHALSAVTLLTLWAFIGLESATTPAGAVKNPSKTIPRAIVLGTSCVALLYFLNSLGILGLLPGGQLINSAAPYTDAAQEIFGGNWHLVISLIAAVVCVGTLNAWILASSQISLGLSEDGFLPSFFSKKNKNGAPFYSLFISLIGIIVILILTAQENFAEQIKMMIDFSVASFLFVYIVCCLAFLKLMNRYQKRSSYLSYGYGFGALLFCCWVLYETPLQTLLIAFIFTLTGIPLFVKRFKILRNLKSV